MNKTELTDILEGILRNKAVWEEDDVYVDEPSDDVLEENDRYTRYKVIDNSSIQVERWVNGQKDGSGVKGLRDIIWKKCHLENVCKKYEKQYNDWVKENNGVPYMETLVTDEMDGKSVGVSQFIRNYWNRDLAVKSFDDSKSLCLVLAECGVGKTSFCHFMRHLAADEIREAFLNGSAAFPVVIDLNEFCSGSFEGFIETELLGKYNLSLKFRIFKKLCHCGYFMVVMDAWDQMRGVSKISNVRRDFNQMSTLWEKEGHVIITCRRSFYQQQLKEKGKLSRHARLFRLQGFDQRAAEEYFGYVAKEEEKKRAGGWLADCWKINDEFFQKPLNIRVLVRHFDVVSSSFDLKREKVTSYQVLEAVFWDWLKEDQTIKDAFMKELVFVMLRHGLARNLSFRQFQDTAVKENWDQVLQFLKDFDFLKINERAGRIKFQLAAFQEFLWTSYALHELQTAPEELDNEKALISRYLLIREVREWICGRLMHENPDCLRKHLDYVKYKKEEEVGFRGSNVLTLLCDLSRIPVYKEQLEKIKPALDKRPLAGTDFRGMDLTGVDFYLSDLHGADFSYSNLTNVNFTGADLANTEWQEYGNMKKCAFLNQEDALCVIAGTSSGGVLTYHIQDNRQDIIELQNDVINDLAGDRGGIYTASSDGWIGYVDKDGNMNSAYIAEGGLQSITRTRNESCVYVGADHQGIYRYHWDRERKYKIEVQHKEKYQVNEEQKSRISDIHYYCSRKNEDYIAYIDGRQLLVLVKLTGMSSGEGVAYFRLDQYQFGEICFADDMLVYSVVGNGIHFIPVEEAVDYFLEEDVLKERCLLFDRDAEAVSLCWAEKAKRIFAAVKTKSHVMDRIYCLDLHKPDEKDHKLDLDWFYGNRNYCVDSDELAGFCVSDDGEYVAFSGAFLAVFQKVEAFYSLACEPVRTKISCKGVNISSCTGLSRTNKKFLLDRGAIEY